MSEAPRFSTPEEELIYLRSKVNLHEGFVQGEKASEGAISRAITDTQNNLAESLKASPEVARQAERVQAAPLDSQLGEMISLTQSKGILQSLAVLEKLGDWKHEDDFHDYLIDQVRGGLPAPKGAESGPLYRALHMTLFEIVMPPTEKKDNETLKTLISSMEQFYAGMISVTEIGKDKNYFVLEIANGNGSEEFVFYVSVPDEKSNLFEKHLLSIFPTAKLVPRQHDYNIFSSGGAVAGSVAQLASSSALPLKTFEAFDHDPLNIILNSFSKIPRDGAGAAFQIVFRPEGEIYTKRYQGAVKQIQNGETGKEAIAERSVAGDFAHSFGEIFFGSKKTVAEDKPKPVDTHTLELLKEKLKSPTVSLNLRLASCAPSLVEAEQILSEIESGFNQFEQTGVNKINWKRVKGDKSFFRNFTFRLFSANEVMPLNLKELTSILHFHTASLFATSQLKQARAVGAPAPIDLPAQGTLLGVNRFQNRETQVYMAAEDRLRHFYCIGQTGTGKSTLLKNMIIQDVLGGNGVCMIDPHGVDIQDVLANIPPERAEDVIYFDPASAERPMGLNMLEYDVTRPEQKTFVVNELFSIFQKLYGGVPESMGPMFEQYFRNATMLVIEDPASGSTLLDVSRVMVNKEFRALKLSRCRNPIVVQFWKEIAEKAGGEGALANIVPYITSKFDVFLANDIMRPIIAQEKSSFDFRKIMDERKILLVNLSKGRLGDMNANLIGLIIVGKILMAALSRVDAVSSYLPPFYLHIDEFQNVTTNSIATILSEARKYKLSLTVAHQFIAQLEEGIKNAVFGNVGSMCAFRVGAEDAEYLEKQFSPTFSAKDLMNIDNRNAYLKMLINGRPEKPFSVETLPPPAGDAKNVALLKKISFMKYGGNREEIEKQIMKKYEKTPTL